MSKRARSVDRVVLNVGGHRFETSISTLTGCSSYFARRFASEWAQAPDEEKDDLFLDMDPDSFKVLLSCMRRAKALLPANDADLFRRVLLDAEFLGCDFLLREVKETVQRHQGSETPTAEQFDTLHGGLQAAFRVGVLPDLFFHPSSSRKKPTIRQLIPAGEHDRMDLISQRSADGPIVKRVIGYALTEAANGERHVEPVISHHMDEALASTKMCTLASEYEELLRTHDGQQDEPSLVTLGLNRYPPTTLGYTVRSAFDHKIVGETADQTLRDALRTYSTRGYRAISTWTDAADGRLKVLLERAEPIHAAAT